MSSFFNRYGFFRFWPFSALNPAAIIDILAEIDGLPVEQIESVLVEGGHVLITLQIDPAQAKQMEHIASMAEHAVQSVRGVKSARVILTAERTAASVQTSTPSHTAIKMGGAEKVSRPLAPHVKHIIAVASGKGGVGKSTVAVNLTVALGQLGLKVGLLDADIYGPSVPTMLGIAEQKPEQQPGADGGDYLQPLQAHGISVMSMGSLVGNDAPMIWRGPMVQSAIQQMLRDVAWGALDILVLDMPPGTGDAQLTVAQKVPLKGALIVSTPQDIAWLDATKGITMFRKVGVPILGVVENMSQFCCPNCGTVTPLFGPSKAIERAVQLETDYLGDIPLDPDLQQSADQGVPLVLSVPEHPVAESFLRLAQQIKEKLNISS